MIPDKYEFDVWVKKYNIHIGSLIEIKKDTAPSSSYCSQTVMQVVGLSCSHVIAVDMAEIPPRTGRILEFKYCTPYKEEPSYTVKKINWDEIKEITI